MKKKDDELQKCFLITPIGSPNSSDRIRVDQWMELIYAPAVKGKYKLIRADKISTPGVITKQIIDNIIDADLVIVDFTPARDQDFPKPNVMYELAIRHITQKPLIQIAPSNLMLPFDIKDFRCTLYDPDDLAYPKKLREEIKKTIDIIDTLGYTPPDIIGQKFDLDKIVADPEKFIEILKEKLFPGDQNIPRLENYGYGGYAGVSLSTVTPYYSGGGGGTMTMSTALAGFNMNCPSCGNSATFISPIVFTTSHPTGQKQYKCGHCGLVFFI